MSRIFINYRRQDSEGYVGRLFDHLVQHFDREDVFMDVDTIAPGVDFVKTLEDAVAQCDVFIAVLGPQWLTVTDDAGQRRLDLWDDFVRLEIASALKQEKFIIPVLVGGVQMPNPDHLPDDLKSLARRNALVLSHHRFGYDVQKLVEAVEQAMPAAGSFLKPDADPQVAHQKAEAIKALRLELVGATESPLYAYRIDQRNFPVLGEGNPDAAILFIGESPGKYEAEVGRPFCGPSGEVLDDLLAGVGLKRDDVFLTNILHDRPTAKRQPTPEEIVFYTPFMDRLIDIIQPVVIVTLGRFAMQYMLKKLDLPEMRQRISDLHGKLIKAALPYGEIHVVPMYHPAVVLYSASQRGTLEKDFEKLRLFI